MWVFLKYVIKDYDCTCKSVFTLYLDNREKDNERTWVNTTQNLTQTQYVLKNVRPVTTYEITVYVIRPNKPINFAVEPIEVTTLQEGA